jgi:Na+/proline symporter
MLRVALFFVSPKDVGLILGILAIIIALPIIAVLALTQVGIGEVSSVLAKVDPITSSVLSSIQMAVYTSSGTDKSSGQLKE